MTRRKRESYGYCCRVQTWRDTGGAPARDKAWWAHRATKNELLEHVEVLKASHEGWGITVGSVKTADRVLARELHNGGLDFSVNAIAELFAAPWEVIAGWVGAR